VQLKKPIIRGFGVFLLLVMLSFIAGELTAEPAKRDILKFELRLDPGAPADTTNGGGTDNPEEDNGDPEIIDKDFPPLLWLLSRWFF
jgi:hypothetical protein